MNFSLQTGYVFFRIIMPLVVCAFQLFLYLRSSRWVREALPERRLPKILLAIVFLVFNVGFLVVMLTRPALHQVSDLFRYGVMYPFFIWHGATLFLGLIFIILSLLKLVLKALAWLFSRPAPVMRAVTVIRRNDSFQHFDASRRRFLRQGAFGLTAVSFAGSSYGVLFGRSSYEINEANFAIASLPAALEGFSIGLVSDIHSSIFMTKPEMDDYVRVVNALKTDMIVVDGDFVNGQNTEVYPFAEAFSQLHAPYGVYGVMGNHDFYAPDPELVAREVNACGIRLLRNESIRIAKDGAEIGLLGIDDTGSVRAAAAHMSFAGRDLPPGIPRILLSHRPYFIEEAARQGVNLVLSGHTHGGQVVLGRLGGLALTPASFASKYIWGKYAFNTTHMYVSRGIGTVGLPMRINCPPEITRITLHSDTGTPVS
jgi:predicted MPP superfamily phosphohydrolase